MGYAPRWTPSLRLRRWKGTHPQAQAFACGWPLPYPWPWPPSVGRQAVRILRSPLSDTASAKDCHLRTVGEEWKASARERSVIASVKVACRHPPGLPCSGEQIKNRKAPEAALTTHSDGVDCGPSAAALPVHLEELTKTNGTHSRFHLHHLWGLWGVDLVRSPQAEATFLSSCSIFVKPTNV